MNGMIGADPDALERLAGDFDRGAGSLESIVLRVRTSVHANPWAGARATRFRTDWDQRHGPQLKRTATTLRAAATQLRRQAAEQRQASSAGGGSPLSRSTSNGPTPARPLPSLLEDTLKKVLTGTEIIGVVDGFREMAKGKGSFLGGGLKVIGVASAFSDFVQAANNRDASGLMKSVADGGFAFAPSPVSIIYTVLKAEIGFYIPLDAGSQDTHLNWMSDRGFSPAQIAERYTGVQGFIDLGNDNVERQAPWMNRAAEWATAKPAEWLYNAGIKLY